MLAAVLAPAHLSAGLLDRLCLRTSDLPFLHSSVRLFVLPNVSPCLGQPLVRPFVRLTVRSTIRSIVLHATVCSFDHAPFGRCVQTMPFARATDRPTDRSFVCPFALATELSVRLSVRSCVRSTVCPTFARLSKPERSSVAWPFVGRVFLRASARSSVRPIFRPFQRSSDQTFIRLSV